MELTKLMKDAGIVGAGGAGFPSYAKIGEGADLLLINGAECEPLLYTDYVILKEDRDPVILGIEAILDHTGIKSAILALKDHTAKRLKLSDGYKFSERVTLKVLGDVYPTGDEISLIHEATGRLVQPGKLPISQHIIVYNVETMYNLGRAVRYTEPVTQKWLTVGGAVQKPCVVKVPVGTKVSELFARLGITVVEGYSVIDGGPSMGKIIDPATASVTKTTKGILVLPDTCRAVEAKLINEKMAVARAETACCQCTRCTDMCPRALLGYPLEPHKMVRTAMGAATVSPKMVISATLCCGCGICESLACSQGISPKAVINNYKELLRQNKMRYISEQAVIPAAEREYRRIPSTKWAQTLGVAKFDTVAEFIGTLDDFCEYHIPLGRHIGIPSEPTLDEGASVVRGELIARGAQGLSVAQHASADGRATVYKDKIVIRRI